jgi:hypothetical protein
LDSQDHVLRLNAQGEEVANLHSQLVKLGRSVDTAELALRLFGNTTRDLVLGLQKELGLTPSGVVDEETAGAIARAIAPPELAAITGPSSGPSPVDTSSLRSSRLGRVRRDNAMTMGPGELGQPIEIRDDELSVLLRRSLAAEDEANVPFVWQGLGGEIVLDVGRVRVAVRDGLVLVGLPVRCDQVRDGTELVVPVAVGTPAEPAGLVATVETVARGQSDLVVAVWGETAVAAVWLAFLDVCCQVAARAGQDTCCRPMLPGAVWAVPGVLGVVPQAQHAIDAAALP